MKATKKTAEWKRAISETHKKKGTTPPYKGIPYKYKGIVYPSKKAASRATGISYHLLK